MKAEKELRQRKINNANKNILIVEASNRLSNMLKTKCIA